MALSIILSTRGRPGTLIRTIEATLKKIALPDTKMLIAVDDDDHGTISVMDKIADDRVVWSVKPREDSLGEKYNRVMTELPADVYLVMVDYAPHVTDGFDAKIVEAASVYKDGYCIVYNHFANRSFPQINAVTHKMAEAMGGIYPGWFPYWFVDHWLDDIGRMTGRIVFADVLIDCSKRPGTMDKCEPGFWGQIYNLLYVERHRIATEIISAPDFDDTEDRKKALIRNFVLTDERAVMINAGLNDDQSTAEPNERYARLKLKVLERLSVLRPDVVRKEAA